LQIQDKDNTIYFL